MSLDEDANAAAKAGKQLAGQLAGTESHVPCPGRSVVRRATAEDVADSDGMYEVGSRIEDWEHCDRSVLPGQLFCRRHGGGAVDVITRAASAVRMEAAKNMIASQLSVAVVQAVATYQAVMNSALAKDADRISAASKLIELAGGPELLATGEDDEVSSAQMQLQDLLLAASDERLDRLAMRIGAIDANGEPVKGMSAAELVETVGRVENAIVLPDVPMRGEPIDVPPLDPLAEQTGGVNLSDPGDGSRGEPLSEGSNRGGEPLDWGSKTQVNISDGGEPFQFENETEGSKRDWEVES